jgi:hypothetical protein
MAVWLVTSSTVTPRSSIVDRVRLPRRLQRGLPCLLYRDDAVVQNRILLVHHPVLTVKDVKPEYSLRRLRPEGRASQMANC